MAVIFYERLLGQCSQHVAWEAYVSYTLKHFGFDTLVVFDESVTKAAEQKVKHLGHHQGISCLMRTWKQ